MTIRKTYKTLKLCQPLRKCGFCLNKIDTCEDLKYVKQNFFLYLFKTVHETKILIYLEKEIEFQSIKGREKKMLLHIITFSITNFLTSFLATQMCLWEF